MSKYNYLRFRWWTHVNLDEAMEQLKDFKVKRTLHAGTDPELSLFRDERDELEVEADTLKAFLTSVRAVLSQREEKPFTARDEELRDKVIKMYPRDRPTPAPWEWSVEPKYEKEKESSQTSTGGM
jgi:hypothetical protein